MRAAIATWGRARWPGVRVIHELVLGERRIDIAFIGERDLIGFELKSSLDRLDRLREQMKEFRRYLPECWVAAAPKWENAPRLKRQPNVVLVGAGEVREVDKWPGWRPYRDELVCSRLLELLWRDEAARIAHRTDVIPSAHHSQLKMGHIKKMLARLLTGNEIIAEVCRELRSRPLVGIGSDPPVGSSDAPHARPVAD
jgi:hypothetical protein